MSRRIKALTLALLILLGIAYSTVSVQAEIVNTIPTVEAVAAHQWRYGFYCKYVPNNSYVEYRIYNVSKKKWAVKSNTRSSAGCLEHATGKSLPSGIIYCQARFVDMQTGEYGAWCEPVYQITQAKPNYKYIQRNLTDSKIKLKWRRVPGATSYEVWLDTGNGLKRVKKTKSLHYNTSYKSDITCPIRVAIVACNKKLSSSVEFVDTFYTK